MRTLLVFVVVAVFVPLTVHAQLPRTAVSVNGLDTNTCAPANPCRSFGMAISKTALNGEVIALDSAGYGTFTVTMGMIIQAAPGVYAGITNASPTGDAVTLSPTGNDSIIIRGLTINSAYNGINVTSKGYLEIDHCWINRAVHDAISLLAPGANDARVAVLDTTISNSGFGIHATSAAAAIAINADHVRAFNTQFPFEIGGNVKLTVTESSVSECIVGFEATDGIVNGETDMSVERSAVSNCGTGFYAHSATQGTTFMRVSNSTATHNFDGFHQAGSASFTSRGNNFVAGNSNSDVVGVIGTITVH